MTTCNGRTLSYTSLGSWPQAMLIFPCFSTYSAIASYPVVSSLVRMKAIVHFDRRDKRSSEAFGDDLNHVDERNECF